MQERNIAIIGLGLIGIRHFHACRAVGHVTVSAIVDVTPQSKAIAQEYGIVHFDTTKDMLNGVQPDGVIIATPNSLHMPVAMECIAHGVPILVEKPLATNMDEAKEMLALAEDKKIPVLTGYFRRFNPVVSAAKAKIEQGAIGDIVSIHCNFWLYKHPEYFHVAWRTQEHGGPIHINLAHDIDTLLHLVGDIHKITTFQSKKNRKLSVEDTAVVICEFKNGALGTLNMSDCIPSPWSWELTAGDNQAYPQTGQSYCFIGGMQGSIELPKNKLWHYQQEGHWYTDIETKTCKKEIQDPLVAQIEHFAEVIAGKSQPLVSGADGLKVMQVIDAIKQSATLSQTIQFLPQK